IRIERPSSPGSFVTMRPDERPSSSRTTRSSSAPSRTAQSPCVGSASLSRTVLVTAGTAAFGASVWAALDRSHDGLSLLLVAFALLAVGAAWLERGSDSAKELPLIAPPAAAAAAGPVCFAAVTGVQPLTAVGVVPGAPLP